MNFKKLIATFTSISITGFVVVALTIVPVMSSSLFSDSSAYAARTNDEEQRKPPEARSSQTLSRRVSSRIFDIMEFRDIEDYASALVVLDEIKEFYDDDRLNEREQYTMWLFYATIAQAQDDYPLAIEYWNEMLTLEENLTPDQMEQALTSLGALNFVLERYREAISIYLRYNEVALEPNAQVYLRIASAHYTLEEYAEGIPYMLRNMEIVRNNGEEVPESTYSLLRAMYISTDDYQNALQILREMIVLFDVPEDWTYLASIQSQLEMFDEQARTYYVSNAQGYLDSEPKLMNLAYQLFNNDNPYGAAMLVEKGVAAGIVEESEKNLSFLSQAYQVAREDAMAVAPLLKAAEISDDGEFYNRLGIIYSTMGEFEASAEAFTNAIEKGDLDRVDQLYMRQARAYYELNRFDEGIAAAREASKDERSEAIATNWVRVLESEKRRYEVQESNRVLYEGYFR